ncbi:MAG: mechanosensitive ion channel [Candidatus Berkelbacteria bacterium]|nr:mechanosensitive ion channel [Candidatus Berkelbacteria bacterium]
MVAIILGYILIRLAQFFLKRILKLFRLNHAMRELLTSLASVFLWVLFAAEIATLLGLSNLAIAISGSAVAFGFAIASGASALASDVIAGLSLAKDRDFEVGFRIKVGDVEGIIQGIDVRKVRILSDNGLINVVPNSKIDNANGWTVIERKK